MFAAVRALFLCFAVASAGPTPSDIEQLVCQLATSKQVEDKAVGAICATIAAKFPSVHLKPDCVTLVESVWDSVATKFPKDCKGLPTPPTPAEIGKLACQVATQKMIEERAVESVCGLINRTFPNVDFSPDCKSVIEGAWDLIAFECPKGHEAAKATLPSPVDIEKMVCALASKKMIEDRATDAICSLINRTFPNVPDCKKLVEGAWNLVLSHCPKGNEVATATLPSPVDIEKIVCEFASQKMVEDRATGAICSLINRTFPNVPDCKRLVEGAWDLVLSHCPKGNAGPKTFPSPGDIEKLVCGAVNKTVVQQRVTRAICSMVHYPNCQRAVGTALKVIADECSSKVPLPEEVEKIACEFAAKKDMEDKAAKAACKIIHSMNPDVPAWACTFAMKKKWEAFEAKCPKEIVLV